MVDSSFIRYTTGANGIAELVSEGHSFRKEWASSVSELTGHVSHFRKYTLL